MILMNKFARIYSYFPHLVFMLMFRLLLHDEKPVYAKNTLLAGDANSKTVRSSDNVLSDEGGGDVAEIFVAVIYPKSKETIFSRVIKQTVASLSADFTAATNWKVVPHYTAIDDNDGYAVQDIEKACAAWNHKPIIAAVVFSSFKSGFGHVLTSLHNNIPVLWATGEVQPGYFERVPLSRFEVRLDPGSYQVLRSLRSLLVATHWHAFTVMHTTTLLASRTYKDIISQPPLVPTILQFTSDSTSYYIFRLLSDVSKSTKGVIVLICEGVDAKRVIEESKKLNMVNGDFVWLWIDTGAMLLNDKSIKLDKLTKDTNLEATELRKVRHIPNLYVNENKTQTTSNRSKKILRNRDNNLVTSNNNNNNNNNVFCNHVNRSDVIYENKTDTKSVHNTSNEILLPNGKEASSSSASTINALMKHHFTLYRKKARRVAKDAEKITRSSTTNAEERKSVKLMNTAPIRLKSTNGGSSESTPLLLSVINDEPKNLSNGLINNGSDNNGRREKRAKFVKNSVSNTTTVSSPSPSIVSSSSASTTSTKRKQRNAKYLDMWKNMTRSARRNDDNRRSVAYASTAASRTAGSTNTIVKRLAAVHDDEHFDFGVPIFAENVTVTAPRNKTVPEMPVGILALQLIPPKVDKNYVKSTLKLLIGTLKEVIGRYGDARLSKLLDLPRISCFDFFPIVHDSNSIMEEFTKNLKQSVKEALAGQTKLNDTRFEESWNSSLAAKFKILNLVPEENIAHNKSGLHLSKKKANATTLESRKWRTIGSMVGEENVHLETIVWPGGDIIPVSTGRGSRSIFRIVTAFAPPFVMIGELDEDGQCLRGIECHQFLTSDKDNLTLLFNEMERTEEEIEVNVLDRIQAERSKHIWEGIDDIRNHHFGRKFKTNCCYGLSMDLLENVAEELEFDFQLYIVADGLFGSRTMAENGEIKWNGIVGDLISGAAHMSFSALSVSSSRAQFIDFSVPYFFSGVSFLAAPKESTDIPLLAFLLPFSPNLWIAIFTSLHVTAIAVAIYEWLSPFGLNPWGRQRSKNFGMASALWVMWGLLCGHLVQFKAPKSWPNKFLINVWGGFSVIFIASYTANIAALIAGLFFHTAVGDHHDHSLLSQRVAAPKSSAAEYYVRSSNQILWDHMQRYSVISVAEGVQLLKNGSLDILIADTPILDYYRATDHGCKLQKVGDTINEDTYAIGMMKGFPLKDSISAVIAKYATNGYIDILQEKWYGGLPCFKLATDMAQPRPLGVAAVAGVFLMLGLGVVVGCLILLSEHLFYKYTLPSLRKKPKSSIWKSRNVMFFSQKLYRFINCVELVSPHHAARELVHTLRQGQITSLFQKSVRRKEHEQRQQQQKSKAQFFEMIQEIRRIWAANDGNMGHAGVQQEERKDSNRFDSGKGSPRKKYSKNQQLLLSPTGLLKHRNRLSPGRLDFARRLSKDVFRSKSSGNLDVSRLGSDINVATGRFFDFYDAQAIGRRLSHGTADNSPPDLNTRRASQFLRDDISCTEPSPSDSDVPENNVPSKGISSSPSDSNLVKSPKSPTSAPSSSLSSNLFSPRSTSNSMFSRDIGPVAARKFSNVDSSSFRGIKSDGHKKISAPRLTLNNEEFISCEGGNCDEEEYRSSEMVRNNSVKSNEHIIEIVIPSESTEDGSHAEKCGDSIPRLNQRRRSSHADRENEISADPSTAAYDETGDDSKPKILLHFPKKKKDARTQCEDVTAAVPRSSSTNCPLTGALLRLSTEELLSLAQLSEKDLKRSLLKALDEKSST